MFQRQCVGRTAVHIKLVTSCLFHCFVERPLAHTPTLFASTPIRLIRDVAKSIYSFEAHVVRSGVAVVTFAHARAFEPRDGHVACGAALKRCPQHGDIENVATIYAFLIYGVLGATVQLARRVNPLVLRDNPVAKRRDMAYVTPFRATQENEQRHAAERYVCNDRYVSAPKLGCLVHQYLFLVIHIFL